MTGIDARLVRMQLLMLAEQHWREILSPGFKIPSVLPHHIFGNLTEDNDRQVRAFLQEKISVETAHLSSVDKYHIYALNFTVPEGAATYCQNTIGNIFRPPSPLKENFYHTIVSQKARIATTMCSLSQERTPVDNPIAIALASIRWHLPSEATDVYASSIPTTWMNITPGDLLFYRKEDQGLEVSIFGGYEEQTPFMWCVKGNTVVSTPVVTGCELRSLILREKNSLLAREYCEPVKNIEELNHQLFTHHMSLQQVSTTLIAKDDEYARLSQSSHSSSHELKQLSQEIDSLSRQFDTLQKVTDSLDTIFYRVIAAKLIPQITSDTHKPDQVKYPDTFNYNGGLTPDMQEKIIKYLCTSAPSEHLSTQAYAHIGYTLPTDITSVTIEVDWMHITCGDFIIYPDMVCLFAGFITEGVPMMYTPEPSHYYVPVYRGGWLRRINPHLLHKKG